MRPQYRINGCLHEVVPKRQGHTRRIAIDGRDLDVAQVAADQHRGTLIVAGHRYAYHVAQDDGTLYIHLGGRHFEVGIVDEFQAAGRHDADGDGDLRAPMPGVVEAIYVAVGDRVAAGQPVLLIESMKLQTEIHAPVAGTVSAINVEVGGSFQRNALLVAVAAASEEHP